MSSSIATSALSRTRSLRKPSTTTDTTGASGESKCNVSPSRLPVKGQAQTSTTAPAATRTSRSATATTTTTSAGTGTGTAKSSRPLSGVFTRITTSGPTRQREKNSPGPQASPPSRLTRASSIRQSSTSTRATASGADSNMPSAVRPTTSSGVPTSRRVASGAGTGPKPGHARAKSSVTALSSVTTLRPPSQTSSTSSSTTTATADRSRPPLSSLGRTRPSAAPPAPPSPKAAGAATEAAHRRQPSNPSTSPTTTSGAPLNPKPKPRQPHQAQVQGGQPTTTTKLEPRPAFTTHQQHYSPAKSLAPKPLTSTFLTPPSPSKLPSNIALSAETARLQTELLQLHLLHRDAAVTVEGWKRSAREKLQRKFEDVRSQEEEVSDLESKVEEEVNAAALLEWGSALPGDSGSGSGSTRLGLDEKVALLDQIVTGLWSVVGEPGGGGRYDRVVRKFEKWCGKVEAAMLARRQQQKEEEGEWAPELEEEVIFIEEMDASWKEECAALVRRLDEWRRGLRELPDPITVSASTTAATGKKEEAEKGSQRDDSSSLARILAGCRALVHGMLAELNLMEQIEQEAAAEEMRWVREMNRRGLGGMDDGVPRAGAIWRVL